MNILIVSNQSYSETGRGNPIVYIFYATYRKMFPEDQIHYFVYKLNSSSRKKNNQYTLLRRLWYEIKQSDLINIHFSSYYTVPVLLFSKINNVKVVITYHGTDLHGVIGGNGTGYIRALRIKANRFISLFAMILSDKNILVSNSLFDSIPRPLKSIISKNTEFIRLGVDLKTVVNMDKIYCRKRLNLAEDIKYFLFSYFSSQSIKRIDIAEAIIKHMGPTYKLLVMSDISYTEVPYYLNASDYLLLTSEREGSPNIIREALAVDVPVFSVDVGNIFEEFSFKDNCFLIERDPISASKNIKNILANSSFEETRTKVRKIHSMEKMAYNYHKVYHTHDQ